MKNKTIIFSGKIQTGKTTSLFQIINKLNSVDGILQPVVDEKRRLYHIASRTIRDFEVVNSSKETISIGKYNFLRKSFDWANDKIIAALNSKPDWLIVDEIGKLEVNGEGLDKSIKVIIENIEDVNTKLIFVIRDYLVEDAISRYKFGKNGYNIITDLNIIRSLI